MSDIAFLGLGAMGGRMASRLVDAGHHVTVWNRTPERAEALVAKGARVAETPRRAAEGAEFVLSMVRDDAASRTVWEADGSGALHALGPGMTAVEMSTLTTKRARELADAANATGAHFVDAPLAGSRPQAEAGQLIFFAGGDAESVDTARTLLLAMGGAVHHAGDAGAGMAMKLLVNALFGAQVVMVAELLALGEALGIRQERSAKILGETPVMSLAARGAAASMIASAFDPMFPIDLVEKDFGYVESSGTETGTYLPLTGAVRSIYAEGKDEGLGADNITGIAKLYRAHGRRRRPPPTTGCGRA